MLKAVRECQGRRSSEHSGLMLAIPGGQSTSLPSSWPLGAGKRGGEESNPLLYVDLCPPKSCAPVNETLLGNSLCRCNQIQMSSLGWALMNMTGVLMKSGEHGVKTETHREKMVT